MVRDSGPGCALVTGAASGIGLACATAFARSGRRVIALDRDAAMLAERAAAFGDGAITAAVDVADADAVRAAFDGLDERRVRVDATVHCAGITLARPLLEMSPAEWRSVLGVNLDGSFHVLQAAARRMIDGGAIVLMSSVTARFAVSGRGAYAASKAGIEALVRAAALELGPLGIRVNAIAPGVVETPLAARHHGTSPDNPVRRAFLARTPLERVAQPDEIAALALLLCSPAAAYVTGQVLAADGGYGAVGMRLSDEAAGSRRLQNHDGD